MGTEPSVPQEFGGGRVFVEAFWVFDRELGVSRVFGGRQPDLAEEVYVSNGACPR